MNKEQLKEINGGINFYSMTNLIVNLIYLIKVLKIKLVK